MSPLLQEQELFAGAFGIRIDRAAGGKVVFCCFQVTKQEDQAENLCWFCSLSSCRAIPQSSRCATVLLCGGTCAVGEGRDFLCRKFQILVGQRKEAKKNKAHLQKCRGEVTCLWPLIRQQQGEGAQPVLLPLKPLSERAWPGTPVGECSQATP